MIVRDRVRVGLLVTTAALVVAALIMAVAMPVSGMEDGRVWALAFIGFPVAAVLLLWRRPGNVIGRLLGLVGLAAGGGIFFVSWFAVTFVDHPASPVAEAFVTGSGGTVLIGSVVAILLLFPTGRPLPGMEWTFSAFLAVAAAWTVVASARVGPMPITGRDNPLGIHGLSWMVAVLEFVPFAFLVLAVWTLGRRHRRGGSLERVQLKWLFSSAVLVLVASTAAGLTPADASPPVLLAFGLILVVGFWSVPVTIVIAISRYRLYEIDRVVSRTVSYATLTVILATAYLAGVLGAGSLVRAVTGEAGGDLVVAASTLGVAALFGPARRRIQYLVDRRFNRARYDARKTVEEFTQWLRNEVDLTTVRDALTTTAGSAVQPQIVSVWLHQREAAR